MTDIDCVEAVAIRAIEILTECSSPSDDWAEMLSFAECCAKKHRSFSWWFDLHVYLTLVELAEEIGFGSVIVGSGFDDLSIVFKVP
jgi:hypothetical protein